MFRGQTHQESNLTILSTSFYEAHLASHFLNPFFEMWPLKHGFQNKLFSKYADSLTCGNSICNITGCKIPLGRECALS